MMTIAACANPEDSVTCVVRLLLIYALRTGACRAKSMDEVVEAIRADPHNTLPWVYPNRPLMCKLGTQGSVLLLDEPAGTRTMLRNTKFAADKSGVLAIVKTHDLRRGYFRDLAHMKGDEIRGAATHALTVAGGHSMKAVEKGLTDSYIGGIGMDLHTARISQPAMKNDARAPPMDLHRPFKKTRLSSTALDLQCQEWDLDSAVTANRKRAGRSIHASEWQAWSTGGTTTNGEK